MAMRCHGIEHGLAEVRDAMQGLTPAENLVGFNEAVGFLAEKIDLIVAQKDPATLQQLESAITTLRGVSAHIASNETVRQLADDVAVLAEKVEGIANASAAGEALSGLEHRIAALADTLAERSQNGDTVPPLLESLVNSLSEQDRAASTCRAATTSRPVIWKTASSSWSRNSTLRIRVSAISRRSSAALPICWCISRRCAPRRAKVACAAMRR